MEESYVVKKILRAVPFKFFRIALTIEQFGELDTMNVEEVAGRFKAHEELIQGKGEVEENKLLITIVKMV